MIILYKSLKGKLSGKIADKTNDAIHTKIYEHMPHKIRCMYYQQSPITMIIESDIYDILTEYKLN